MNARASAARARLKVARDFARARERVNQLVARTLSVCEQARDAAPVNTAARSEQVVARAPGDAAKLKLSFGGRFAFARVGAREREARVTFYRFARGEQSVALLFMHPRVAASLDE